MGCNLAKPREEVIKSLSLSQIEHGIQNDNRQKIPDPSEEESIKQVSYIAVVSDNKPRTSDDQSIFKMIQDI